MKNFKLVETLQDKDGNVFQAVTFYEGVDRKKMKKATVNYVLRNKGKDIRYLYRITECKVIKPNKLTLFNKKTKI